MTREDILKEILELKGTNWLLELATGTGKSKLALEKIKSLNCKSLLLVVNRIVHKQNWADEITKWWKDCAVTITITTYRSLHKHAGTYDCAIFDECHHLSALCRKLLKAYKIKHSILCSATVKDTLKEELNKHFKDLTFYKKGLRSTINDNILPDPKVFLLPLSLQSEYPTEVIYKNPKASGKIIECSFANRWNYLKTKNPVRIYCTEKQYLYDLNSQIEYWKTKYMRSKNNIAKNKWLKLCSDRLTWLSNKKVATVLTILTKLKNYRTLTFCNNILQTEMLGKYCINSKNKYSIKTLSDFNQGKINHITACNILNEGMNLVNCQVGIYANLNSSETIVKQRCGRLLRHKNPVLIIPYYKNTREEELVKIMLEDYNPKLVTIIQHVKEIEI